MTRYERAVEERLAKGFCTIAAVLASLIFITILVKIFFTALPALTVTFLINPESVVGVGAGHGILNAIVGTMILALSATLLAIPLAIGTAIYLQKYATNKRLTGIFRFFLEVLAGTPSIVLGIFGLMVLVILLRQVTGGFSLLSGAIALSILIMPVIERTIEEAISKIPRDLEEGSYALGATKWQTIRGIVIPIGMTGILTAAILGFGRAAEESAVVVLTAGYSQFLPEFTVKANSKVLGGLKIYPLQDLVGTLPASVYNAYQNQHIVPVANAFAAAFILILIVLVINLTAKIIVNRSFITGSSGPSALEIISRKLSFLTKTTPKTSGHGAGQPDGSILMTMNSPEQPASSSTDAKERSTGYKADLPGIQLHENGERKQPQVNPAITFLRTLLPFAIPTVLFLLITLLMGIPPFHHALGPASPFLAGVFAAGLSLIIGVAGLAFALLLAKSSGAFKKKNRRIGYAGVITGFCILLIAGLVCASAAGDVFSTGTGQAGTSIPDRNAQLAAMLAAGETGSGQPSAGSNAVVEPLTPAPSSAAPVQGNDTGIIIPRKDSLSIGESYWWGDAQHTCRATIYDYKVLPFYFWWWIDYNRFVIQVPPEGQSYLVIFIRIENVGSQSAVVPTADTFNVSFRGNSTARIPYLNKSVFSTNQINELGVGSSPTLHEQYYQWIREIGQTRRDYAYLTGENLFTAGTGTSNATSTTTTVTVTPPISGTSGATNSSDYNGAFLKPGQSQAIDGYLIFPIPGEAVNHLNETYVDVAFNSLSNAQWKIGS